MGGGSTDGGGAATGGGTATGGGSAVGGGAGTGGGAVSYPSGSVTLLGLGELLGQISANPGALADGGQQPYGGAAILSALFAAERADAGTVLIVASGDQFGASPVLVEANDDVPATDMMNLLRIDAAAFGHHEFVRDNAWLRTKLSALTHTRYVATNMTNVATELGASVATPYLLLDVDGGTPGFKVAVLGVMDPNDAALASTMGTSVLTEPVQAASAQAAAARDAGASVVVALAHMATTASPSGPLIDFANAVTAVDIVIGGRATNVGLVTTTGSGTLVVANRGGGRTYSKVSVTVVDGGVVSKQGAVLDAIAGTGVRPTGCVTPPCSCPTTACPGTSTCVSGFCYQMYLSDPQGDAIVQAAQATLQAKEDPRIGSVDTALVKDSTLSERKMETPMGDFVADSLLTRYRSAGATIAVMNGGSIRAGLPSAFSPTNMTLHRPTAGYVNSAPWDLVVGDAYSVHPFGNTAVLRTLTGMQLHQLLEQSAFQLPNNLYGGFLQVAGIKVHFSLSQPPGARITSLVLDTGFAIPNNTSQSYNVVMSDFTSAGGDGYALLSETLTTPGRETLAHILLDYIADAGTTITAPPPNGGRINLDP
jgi:5'-nucleotidase